MYAIPFSANIHYSYVTDGLECLKGCLDINFRSKHRLAHLIEFVQELGDSAGRTS
jgi:hypothetical protein